LEPSGEIPCILYAAKSTEDRRGSIPDQLLECRAASARVGAEPLTDHGEPSLAELCRRALIASRLSWL
jgi:hypothetical protein